MPKHALAPTRKKPSADPGICGSSSTATPVVLSNEVLLRSKIAQLQLERAKQQRKGKNDNGAAAAPTPSSPLRAREQQAVAVAAAAAAAAAAVGATSSSSANAAHVSGRKAGTATSKHRLANPQAGQSRPQNGQAAAAAASGVKGKPGGAEGRGERDAARVESEEEVMRRFEAQVILARKEGDLQITPPGSSENSGTPPPQQQQRWHGFTPQGIQALRDMYREQVQAARTMTKQADTLTRKTQEMEKLNEVMRAEAEADAREAARLNQAAAKLQTLSGELDGRRTAMLEARNVEAGEETARREEMNASLNAVVSDISKKIKEQEEERIAQDAENASLRSDLQVLLQTYDENKAASEKSLRGHEEESVKLAKRLESLTAAAQMALGREEGLRKAIGELAGAEGVLRKRVGEHATRLERQEAGLKTYLESVQRLQANETKLLVSIARLSKEKTSLLARAGCLVVGGEGGVDDAGGGGGGGEEGSDRRGDEKLGADGMRALLHEKKQAAAEAEREKDRLQARCRELQAERKAIASKAESVAATTAERDEGEAGDAEGETEIGTAEDKIENGGTAQEEACTAS
ncbi:unnamed protein product [Ectocarpus sp. 12 AP-2014]